LAPTDARKNNRSRRPLLRLNARERAPIGEACPWFQKGTMLVTTTHQGEFAHLVVPRSEAELERYLSGDEHWSPAVLITPDRIASRMTRLREHRVWSIQAAAREYLRLDPVDQERPGERTPTQETVRKAIAAIEAARPTTWDPGYVEGLLRLYERRPEELVVSDRTIREHISSVRRSSRRFPGLPSYRGTGRFRKILLRNARNHISARIQDMHRLHEAGRKLGFVGGRRTVTIEQCAACMAEQRRLGYEEGKKARGSSG